MRNQRFTFLCSIEERQLLTALAKHLQRSQSDSIRILLLKAARELGWKKASISLLPEKPNDANNG